MAEDPLDRARVKVLTENNAQAIHNELRRLHEYRDKYLTRWLWELIQNALDARDSARPLDVEVSLATNRLVFRHNGSAFGEDEVAHLIYHGSTKAEGRPDALGKFGTGFLSTHLLCSRVSVAGKLDGGSHFNFELDRSGGTPSAIQEAMESSWSNFRESLRNGKAQPSEWTTYTYPDIAPSEFKSILESIPSCALCIPFLLAFNASLNVVNLSIDGKGWRWRRLPPIPTGEEGLQLVAVEEEAQPAAGSPRRVLLALLRHGGLCLALPCFQEPSPRNGGGEPLSPSKYTNFLPHP